MLNIKIIEKSEAPKPVRGSRQLYKPLYDKLESMNIDQILLLEFESKAERDRVAGSVHSYFGPKSYSFKRVDRDKLLYAVSHVTSKPEKE